MPKFRTLSLGMILAAGPALAEEPRPAVRLLPAQVMDPVEAITARAASDSGFNPFPAPPPTNDGAKVRTMMEIGKDTDDAPKDSNWKKFTKWMDDRAKAVKKAVTGPPEPQPEARVGQVQQPPKRFFETKKPPANPEANRIAAASPAYRWYGYGTATPGANQYAPAGDYPHGSAQWYNQTGATPGAFPVPTMNPYRPAPGAEQPVYVTPPTYTTLPAPVYVVPPSAPRVPSPPPRQTIAETPTRSPNVPMVAPPMPSVIGPANPVPQPPTPPLEYRGKISNAKPAETTWQPASATEPVPVKPEENNGLIIPIIRGAEPSFDDSPLAKQIQAACRGLATNVTIRETGPRELVISFHTTTKAVADIAVKAIANIAEVKPYRVEFVAKVSQ